MDKRQGGTMRQWVVVAALGAFAFAAVPARAEMWNRSYKVTGRPEVHVETNDAVIEVSSWDNSEVAERVVTNGYSISDNEVRIVRAEQNGNRIDLEVRIPRTRSWWGNNNRSVRIEITVPRAANLDLHTSDGHIHASGVSGDIRLETGDGHLEASGLKGSIRLHTGDGHIEATEMDGSLDASTRDGRVRVRGRFDDLRVQTGDGSLTADILSGSKMTGNWSLSTSNGSISVRLPDVFAADIDAHTGDGNITSQLPMLVSGLLGSRDLRGKLGGGGPTLQIRTGDGSIRLERL
jgi:DUF4097 and DUF4098 domain-containing protein YvlB